jgi:uncharacterized FlgJ-related protein
MARQSSVEHLHAIYRVMNRRNERKNIGYDGVIDLTPRVSVPPRAAMLSQCNFNSG